jgi:hypothetical protein
MTPMARDSRKGVGEEGFEWGHDTIETEIRERVRGMIEAIVEEELESALGAGKSQRVGAVRTGYRHGARTRQLSTSLGQTRNNGTRRPHRISLFRCTQRTLEHFPSPNEVGFRKTLSKIVNSIIVCD